MSQRRQAIIDATNAERKRPGHRTEAQRALFKAARHSGHGQRDKMVHELWGTPPDDIGYKWVAARERAFNPSRQRGGGDAWMHSEHHKENILAATSAKSAWGS